MYNMYSIVSSIEFDKDADYFAIAGVTKKIKVSGLSLYRVVLNINSLNQWYIYWFLKTVCTHFFFTELQILNRIYYFESLIIQ